MNIEDWARHAWEYLATIARAVLSFAIYKYKKKEKRIDDIEHSIENSKLSVLLMQEKLINIVQDIEEIKQDLKKILFKL